MFVIGLIGGSTIVGTEPPYAGSVIPPGITYYKSGNLQTSLSKYNTGPQSGLFTCLSANAVTAIVVERATPGINASNLQSGTMPALLADFASLGLLPDVVVSSHGGNDAKNLQYATNYGNRFFGPWWDRGPHSTDSSVVGQLRSVYPGTPFVVSTLPTHNGQNLLLGIPETGVSFWHDTVRTEQISGCARTADCYTIITDPNVVTLAADDHPDSSGYYAEGWQMCSMVSQILGL